MNNIKKIETEIQALKDKLEQESKRIYDETIKPIKQPIEQQINDLSNILLNLKSNTTISIIDLNRVIIDVLAEFLSLHKENCKLYRNSDCRDYYDIYEGNKQAIQSLYEKLSEKIGFNIKDIK